MKYPHAKNVAPIEGEDSDANGTSADQCKINSTQTYTQGENHPLCSARLELAKIELRDC